MTTTTAPSRTATPTPRWVEPALLAAATILLRIPALLASRHLTFDDGVFGASAVAMREGDLPFRDVFSSQGPLFLPLVFVADLLGLRTLDAPRLLAIASGVGMVLATWAIGRRFADRRAAVIAALLVATSGSVLFVTGPLAADGPALALAAFAVAMALRWRAAPSTTGLLAVGALTGAALMVKALVIPVAVPVGLVLLLAPAPIRQRLVRLVAAVAAAVVVALVPSVLLGFADVWDQSITYHLEVAGERTPLANLGKVFSTFASRDAMVLAVAVVAVGTLVVAILRKERARPHLRLPDGQLTGGAILASWLLAVLLVLTLEHPLWRPHVAHLVIPVALLAVLCRPTTRAVVLAALVGGLTFWFPAALPILWPEPYLPAEAEAVDALQQLPAGALAISDDPGLVYRSGRLTPPDWVDGSILLVETERVTEDSIVAEAERPEVCAVVVWSGRWGDFEDLPDRLADAGYEVGAQPEPDKTVYVKEVCAP
jgi:4-amino-4-deoxy-L-arabinose transferase-like glycosyltransferase